MGGSGAWRAGCLGCPGCLGVPLYNRTRARGREGLPPGNPGDSAGVLEKPPEGSGEPPGRFDQRGIPLSLKGIYPFRPKGYMPFTQRGISLLSKGVYPFRARGYIPFTQRGISLCTYRPAAFSGSSGGLSRKPALSSICDAETRKMPHLHALRGQEAFRFLPSPVSTRSRNLGARCV